MVRHMKRGALLVGSLMLVVGFILYQFGLSYELHPTSLLGRWLARFAENEVPWNLSLEVVAVLLQFVGGLLAIFGLIVCFAGVSRSDGAKFQSKPVDLLRIKASRTVTNCRFCGAEIRQGSPFCPNCNRSQI